VIRPVFALAFRLRAPAAVSAGAGLVAVSAIAGALFPAVGHTIGKLDLPRGVADLLGGADYGTVAGWFNGEIASVYGPLVVGAVAITAAAATTAGEEENRILALLLGHPVTRARLIVGKAAAMALGTALVAAIAWAGLELGVALAGGGIAARNQAALALHLGCFGLATGAVALALGAGTGRRGLAVAGASGFTLAGYLIAGFAPLVDGLAWLRYLATYHYYSGHDPLANGVGIADCAVLVLFAVALTAVAAAGFERRDLRG